MKNKKNVLQALEDCQTYYIEQLDGQPFLYPFTNGVKAIGVYLTEDIDCTYLDCFMVGRTNQPLAYWEEQGYVRVVDENEVILCDTCEHLIPLDKYGLGDYWRDEREIICATCLRTDQELQLYYLETIANDPTESDSFLSQKAFHSHGFKRYPKTFSGCSDTTVETLQQEGYEDVVIKTFDDWPDNPTYDVYVR